MKLSIIIPAYNESESIAHTASKIRPVIANLQNTYDVEVIFVDDGSTDNTWGLLQAEFADADYVNIISYEKNKGLGGAVRTGFEHATGDLIITTDFDGTYEFATIPEMLSYLDGATDMVVASPYHPLGAVEGVPKYRLLFSFGASALYRILVNPKIYCWTSLFRVYRRSVIDATSFETDGFLCNTELLINAIKHGFKVKEFPTVLHTRQYGQSSIRIAQVTMAHLKYQRQLLMNSNKVRVAALAFSTLMVGVIFLGLFTKHPTSDESR